MQYLRRNDLSLDALQAVLSPLCQCILKSLSSLCPRGKRNAVVVPTAKDEQVLDQHTQAASCTGKIWVVYLLPLVES